jgi:hypothetical protein
MTLETFNHFVVLFFAVPNVMFFKSTPNFGTATALAFSSPLSFQDQTTTYSAQEQGHKLG